MTKINEIKSPAFSLKGWKFIEWLKGNWKTIKELIKVGVPLVLGLQFFAENPSALALTTAIGKLAIDTIEYYVKEKK